MKRYISFMSLLLILSSSQAHAVKGDGFKATLEYSKAYRGKMRLAEGVVSKVMLNIKKAYMNNAPPIANVYANNHIERFQREFPQAQMDFSEGTGYIKYGSMRIDLVNGRATRISDLDENGITYQLFDITENKERLKITDNNGNYLVATVDKVSLGDTKFVEMYFPFFVETISSYGDYAKMNNSIALKYVNSIYAEMDEPTGAPIAGLANAIFLNQAARETISKEIYERYLKEMSSTTPQNTVNTSSTDNIVPKRKKKK